MAVLIVAGGCFDGAAATGLPCREDKDCGLADRCIEGVCGGPAASTTTLDPSTSSSGSDPSTGTLLCDGQPAAECEPEVVGLNDANCDADCSRPRCGDGLYNALAENDALDPPMGPEECDDGDPGSGQRQDSASCDADCTLPACGDGRWNPVAETCDDGDDDEFDGCTIACQAPVLATRFDDATWTSEPYDLSAYAGTDWANPGAGTDVTGWRWSEGRWRSGAIPYRELEDTYSYNYSGVTRLVSPPIDLPATVPAGFALQLRFRHTLTVEAPCANDPMQRGDGGVVRLRAGAGEQTIVPAPGYAELQNLCGVPVGSAPNFPNPLFAEGDPALAFTGPAQTGDVVVDLTGHLGEQGVRLVFEFATDCLHCVDEDFSPSEWEIDDVIVAAFPSG